MTNSFSAAGSVVTVCPIIVVVWAFISKEDYRAEAARVVTAVQALLKSRTGRISLELKESYWCGRIIGQRS